MLRKANISNDELMDMMGMTDAYLQEKLDEGLNATKTISVIPIPPKFCEPGTGDLPKANSKNVEYVDVDDFAVRHKYLDTAYKLKDKYPSLKQDVNFIIPKVVHEVQFVQKGEEPEIEEEK